MKLLDLVSQATTYTRRCIEEENRIKSEKFWKQFEKDLKTLDSERLLRKYPLYPYVNIQ